MRFRPLASLSVAAAAVLLMAGCSASAPDADTTASAAGDLCAAAAAPGAASDAVAEGVAGDVGVAATASFTAPLDVAGVERTVVSEGDGEQLAVGDFVSYGFTAFDAATGATIASVGYDDAPIEPQALSVEGGLDQLVGCVPVGSRIVAALPASSEGGAQVFVLDVLDASTENTWCAAGAFTGEAPTVTFAEGGRPTVTIPQGDLPQSVSLEVLTEGDGDVVAPGDMVEVNYEGVRWSDGTGFDSSWERGEPASFQTDGVVDGFRVALEGQKVGSTVLVAMPPACGYGAAGSSQHELAGETLVFVVEILGITE